MAFSVSNSSVFSPSGEIESESEHKKRMEEIERKIKSESETKCKEELGCETNAKDTQFKVTDVYKTMRFWNLDGTWTEVCKNLTAKVALILTYHDYTYVTKAAPRFEIDGDEWLNKWLTYERVEELGRQLHRKAARDEDVLLGKNPELLKIYQAERKRKLHWIDFDPFDYGTAFYVDLPLPTRYIHRS